MGYANSRICIQLPSNEDNNYVSPIGLSCDFSLDQFFV